MSSVYLRGASLAVLGLLACLPSNAQEDERQLETIIISTPGPQRSAEELIGNASSIEREELVARLSGTLGDTLDDELGVATTSFGQGASRPVLRGLGAERVQVLTNGIGVIDASAASPDHQVAADGIDAEKIEILRGPAALAYGGQAIGGVVNVIDSLIVETLPDDPLSLDAVAATNSVNDGLEGGARATLRNGPLVFVLSGSARDFGDYEIPGEAESSLYHAQEAEEEEDHEEEHEDTGLAENTYLETGTISAGLSYVGETGFVGIAIRQQTSEYGLPGHEEHGHEDEEDHDDDHEEEHEDEHGHAPFVDLEQTRVDLRAGLDLDHSIFTRLSTTVAIADYSHTEFEAPGEPGTTYETDGIEGRVELDHTIGALSGAVGLQYASSSFAASGEEALISSTDSDMFGLFLYEVREWDNGAGIEGGLRYEHVSRDNVDQGSKSFDLTSASLGVHRHFDSGWFTGVQASWTQRAPNQSELFADGPHLATSQYERGSIALDKESGLNLEASLRYEGDMFATGLNIFHTDFQDFIYLAPSPIGEIADDLDVFLFSQQDAIFKGGEAYAEARPHDAINNIDWTLRAGVDFVDADLADGTAVPYVPPLTGHLSVKAEGARLSLAGELTLAAKQDDPGTGILPTDAFAKLDLFADFKVNDRIGLFASLRNATDVEIRQATSVLKDTVPSPGRNLRVGMKVNF